MAYISKIFGDNFLHYASYVIKDRAIPDLEDGLKPVQRRILHSLFEMDDGKYHKVANVVGHCMKYHPHGDASIYSALVVLANKELFIDKQGNFGNISTGDEASASRYIECKTNSLAKELFYNPKITEYVDSYDGRNREPVAFPAKIPIILAIGAEGIAVGMSTKILPHNPVEVVEAVISALRKKKFELMPDFPSGGRCDISEYADGAGKVRVRAKMDTSDEKRILITELPFGSTTDSLIASVEAAAKAGKIRIASISDFTTQKVEIEIKLQRGIYAQEVVDALYAFTECEQSISCNLLVISNGVPVTMTVSEVVQHHALRLVEILTRELELEIGEVKNAIHARTLERIFIEERIYKSIEMVKTQAGINNAVTEGLAKFAKEIRRKVTDEDIATLLSIPIRRISLFDINKSREEMKALEDKLAMLQGHLQKIVPYAIGFLESVIKKIKPFWPRKTEITSFSQIDVKEAARHDLALRYDRNTGYLGLGISSGELLFEVSAYDKILVIRKTGMYTVVTVPEKLFVDKNMLYCGSADKENLGRCVFTLVYRDGTSGYPFIKRFRIETWLTNKDYSLIPEGARVFALSTEAKFKFKLKYAPKSRQRIFEEEINAAHYDVRGVKAQGVRLATRELVDVEMPGDQGALAIEASAKDSNLQTKEASLQSQRDAVSLAEGEAGGSPAHARPPKNQVRGQKSVSKVGTAKAPKKSSKPSSAAKGNSGRATGTKQSSKSPAIGARQGSLLSHAEALQGHKKKQQAKKGSTPGVKKSSSDNTPDLFGKE